jgi:hypothetical protein
MQKGSETAGRVLLHRWQHVGVDAEGLRRARGTVVPYVMFNTTHVMSGYVVAILLVGA